MEYRVKLDPAHGPRSDDLQTIVHMPFPEKLNQELEQRYENIFCTLPRMVDGHLLREAAAYIAFEEETPAAIVVYRRDRRSIIVLNKYFALSAHDLERMVRHLLASYRDVDVIVLDAVSVERKRLSYPVQRFNSSEDIVISLPALPEIYFAALGPNTRALLRRAQKLLAAEQPFIDFVFHDRDDAGPGAIDRLVELSRLRIAGKNQVPSHDERSIAELKRMVAAYGVTLVARAGGRICAGVVCTQVGSHFYMHVVTHERGYDHLRLGMLCCYMSICEAIQRGAAEYHLLSGKYDYKFRLLGEQRDFEKIVVYRSRADALFQLPTYLRTLVRGNGRLAKQRLTSWRREWKR